MSQYQFSQMQNTPSSQQWHSRFQSDDQISQSIHIQDQSDDKGSICPFQANNKTLIDRRLFQTKQIEQPSVESTVQHPRKKKLRPHQNDLQIFLNAISKDLSIQRPKGLTAHEYLNYLYFEHNEKLLDQLDQYKKGPKPQYVRRNQAGWRNAVRMCEIKIDQIRQRGALKKNSKHVRIGLLTRQ